MKILFMFNKTDFSFKYVKDFDEILRKSKFDPIIHDYDKFIQKIFAVWWINIEKYSIFYIEKVSEFDHDLFKSINQINYSDILK